ncbi:Hypothetical_protein [Hexamita inflata]|uniref:Hypothetical_protein n=1 Tax=Hexamita inflata TaxID=28002 RepID=A0AA86UIW4_9EUKA|nr:Hypothetical protein HINF_LOCUS45149 [Hexamita inflata]
MQNLDGIYVLRITNKLSSPHSINAGPDGVTCIFIKTIMNTNTQAHRVTLHNFHLQNKTTVQHFANQNQFLCQKVIRIESISNPNLQITELHFTSLIAALLHLKQECENLERVLSRAQYKIQLYFSFRSTKLIQSLMIVLLLILQS